MDTMRKTVRVWLAISGAANLALILAAGPGGAPAAAATYPTRAVDMVVAFAPGGGADVTARLVATYVSKKWGQPINVVNRAGGGGIVGTHEVLTARPDGYTLMMDNHAVNAMLGASQTDLPFKWDERTPIARVTFDPVFYVVKDDARWRSLKEVVAHIKANPKTFRWGTAHAGGISTFAITQFFAAAGVDIAQTNRVVFPGGAPTLTALAGGHVDFAGQQWSEVLGLIAGKKIRALAVVLPERVKDFPDVPTAREAGFPELDVVGWQGVAGPPGLPAEVVERWDQAIREAAADPSFLDQAAKIGKVIAYLGPQDFRKYMQAEYDKYLPLAIKMGIRK
jgi:tripartite-type tricarboxylate transporter receptor subunit TctC